MPVPTTPPSCARAVAVALSLSAALAAQQASPTPLVEATIADLHAAMQSGLLTAEGLAARYRERIEAYDRKGPDLRAILAVNPDLLAEARQRDRAALTSPRGPLFGIPVLLKDNVDALPMPTTAGSVALQTSVPPDDAFLVRRLRAAGAVVLGKATLTEFANFMTTGGMPNGYSSLGGAGANPYDPRRQANGIPVAHPGGSSSGSGIATAANLACVAIGTETSGSILSPGNRNGVVGIKPTLGLVSRDGIIPITADQDTAGPLARTVEDAARVLGVIAGYDANDPATAPCRTAGNCFSDYTQFLDRTALRGKRIAVPPPQFRLDPSEFNLWRQAIGILRAAGATVADPFTLGNANVGQIEVNYPPSPGSSTVLIFGMKRDLNSYLASLGPNAPRKTLADIIAYNNANAATALRFGQSILLAADRYDPTPNSADERRYVADRQRDLTESRRVLDAAFDGPDRQRNTADDYDAILFPANFGANIPARAGYPSIVVPAGLGSTGIPLGVTFCGRAFSEPTLLALAFAFEQATRLRKPPASTPPLPTDDIPMNFASVRSQLSGCSGTAGTAALDTVGPPVVANSTFRLRVSSVRPNTAVALGVSPTSTQVLFGPCVLRLGQPMAFVLGGQSTAAGVLELDAPIPWLPALSGVTIYAQAAAADPGVNPLGTVLSEGLEITIGG